MPKAKCLKSHFLKRGVLGDLWSSSQILITVANLATQVKRFPNYASSLLPCSERNSHLRAF